MADLFIFSVFPLCWLPKHANPIQPHRWMLALCVLRKKRAKCNRKSLSPLCKCITIWAATARFLPRFFFPNKRNEILLINDVLEFSFAFSSLVCVQIIVETRNVGVNLAVPVALPRDIGPRAVQSSLFVGAGCRSITSYLHLIVYQSRQGLLKSNLVGPAFNGIHLVQLLQT